MASSFPLSQWLYLSSLHLCGAIVTAAILYSEHSKRRADQREIVFTTKWSKFSSLITIYCGLLRFVCGTFECLPLFCYFTFKVRFIASVLQGAFMGFYQLDRLCYCFSQSNTHTAKGYPRWVFVIMYTYGLIGASLSFTLWYFIDLEDGACFIDQQLKFHDTFNRRDESNQALIPVVFTYHIWDLLTLLLYACKVCRLRKHLKPSNELAAEQRIMSILQRILILTFLYEMAVLLWLVITILLAVFPELRWATIWTGPFAASIASLSLSYSMYLMQQHNTDAYRRFLLLLKRLRLHYLCCFCCLQMIAREIEELTLKEDVIHCQQTNQDEQDMALDDDVHHDTMNETRTMESLKMDHSTMVQLSVVSQD